MILEVKAIITKHFKGKNYNESWKYFSPDLDACYMGLFTLKNLFSFNKISTYISWFFF